MQSQPLCPRTATRRGLRLIVAIVTLFVPAADALAGAQPTRSHTDPTLGVTVTWPESWTLAREGEDLVLQGRSGVAQVASLRLSRMPAAPGAGDVAAEVANRFVAAVRRGYPAARIEPSAVVVEAAGARSFIAVYDDPELGVRMNQWFTFVPYPDRKSVLIWLLSAPASYQGVEVASAVIPTAASIVHSTRFGGGAGSGPAPPAPAAASSGQDPWERGVEAFKRGDFEQAMDWFARDIASGRNSPSDLSVVHLNRAKAAMNLQRYLDAVRDLGYAIVADPLNARAYQARCAVLALFDLWEQAMEDCDTASFLAPDAEDVQQTVRVMQTEYTSHHSVRASSTNGEAIAELSAELEQTGLDPEGRSLLLTRRGRLWWASGEAAKAMADYEEAVTRDPRNAAAWFQLALAHEEEWQLEAALAALETVERLAPDHPYAAVHREVVLQKLGRQP